MDIHSISISQLTGIKNFATTYSQMEEEYILSRMKFENIDNSHKKDAGKKPQQPVRIDGFTLILCLEGSFSMGINLDNFDVESNTVLLVGPNSIIRFNNASEEKIDAYTLFVSINFLKDINLDINALRSTHFTKKPTPILTLTSEEMAILKRYLDLMHLNTIDNTSTIYVRNIARCLMASLLYQLMQFSTNHITSEPQEETQPQSRRMNYVRDFMALVQKHHCQERSVGFYADKLFISPKYLSLIIKEVTGRSAAEWIDEYVILEAKNLLRFSGKNIQQVAYELNFTNQSSFGKYFKHLTGMSPSEFQRS